MKNTHVSNPPPYLAASATPVQNGVEEDDDWAMDTQEDNRTTTTSTKNPTPASSSSFVTLPFSSLPTNPRYVSDFEPTMQTLDILFAPSTINQDLNMELDEPPVTSLLQFEFAKMKSLENLLEGSPVKGGYPGMDMGNSAVGGPGARGKKGKKRDRKAEAERAKARKAEAAAKMAAKAHGLGEEGEEGHDDDNEVDDASVQQRSREIQASLDSSAGFRTPSLRIMTNTGSRLPSGGSVTTISATGSTGSEGAGIPIPVPVSIPGTIVVNGRKTPFLGSATGHGLGHGHGHGHGFQGPGGNVPKVVNDVDNRGSFKYFNEGWILPADQKRGGRNVGGVAGGSDRVQLPLLSSAEPPRKKMKIGECSSRGCHNSVLCFPYVYPAC